MFLRGWSADDDIAIGRVRFKLISATENLSPLSLEERGEVRVYLPLL